MRIRVNLFARIKVGSVVLGELYFTILDAIISIAYENIRENSPGINELMFSEPCLTSNKHAGA
jgi:hypothetical protein